MRGNALEELLIVLVQYRVLQVFLRLCWILLLPALVIEVFKHVCSVRMRR